MADTQKLFAQVIGVVLILLGLIGFLQSPVLGLIGVNSVLNILHILVGAVALWMANKGNSLKFNKYLGIGAIILGVLGLTPAVSGMVSGFLGSNAATAWVDLVLGILAVGIAYGVKEGGEVVEMSGGKETSEAKEETPEEKTEEAKPEPEQE